MHVTYIDVPERVSPQIAPRLGGTRARDGRASTESDRFTRRRGETNRNETNETNIIIDTLAELSHFFLLFFFPLFLSSLFTFHETLTNLTSLAFRYEAVVGADSSRFPRIIDVACTRARVGGRQGADRGKARSRFRSTHVARKGRIYHTRGLVIMAIVIIIIIIIIIIVIIPKGVIRYRDS